RGELRWRERCLERAGAAKRSRVLDRCRDAPAADRHPGLRVTRQGAKDAPDDDFLVWRASSGSLRSPRTTWETRWPTSPIWPPADRGLPPGIRSYRYQET